ncbi:MAG: hypothetical protein CVU48_02570 [Candidatus Cloacimonetes bacterium HGW-Cloacimonetes-1]|nr:MAG: hypothetical protein CVU48_02570 [Candidatus Cloacimonetes bacterium HGW-Cloacimonetes-1]
MKNRGVIVIEGHVQGLANTRALGKANIPVIVVDKSNCIARYSKYCEKYFKCPDYLTDDFADFLIRLHRAENLQGWVLLPSNDHAVHTIARNKDRLSKLFGVITEDLDTIEKIYNKRELLRIAASIGIPIPQTLMPDDTNPYQVNMRYPIIVKGNNGLSFYKRFRQKAVVINTPTELTKVWHERLNGALPEEYFIQEVIPYVNKTVSVTVFAVNGVVHSYWMGVKLREHPAKFGTATCCKSVHDKEMIDLSRKLVNELKFTGVCEIEWLRDSRDNEPKLIEINARTWLWVDLAIKCGVNFPIIIYKFMDKGEITNTFNYDKGKYWLNIYTDIAYSIVRISKGMDSVKNIAKSYRSFYEACWDRNDVLPFFVYGLLTMRFLKNR